MAQLACDTALLDPVNLDGHNDFTTDFVRRPALFAYDAGEIPRDMEEWLLTYEIVAEVIEDAEHVILLVSEDADLALGRHS